jgi:hypothetical protein
MNLYSDERGFVAGWAVKLILFFALLAIVIYDGAAIAVNHFQLDGYSNDVAIELSSSARDASLLMLEREARRAARQWDARVVKVELNADKSILSVTLRREATTLVVSRVSRFSDWGQTTATGRVPTD